MNPECAYLHKLVMKACKGLVKAGCSCPSLLWQIDLDLPLLEHCAGAHQKDITKPFLCTQMLCMSRIIANHAPNMPINATVNAIVCSKATALTHVGQHIQHAPSSWLQSFMNLTMHGAACSELEHIIADDFSKALWSSTTHREQAHGQVCGQRRIAGQAQAVQVQGVPQLPVQGEGPVQLQLQGVERSQLHMLCVGQVAALQADLLACAALWLSHCRGRPRGMHMAEH